MLCVVLVRRCVVVEQERQEADSNGHQERARETEAKGDMRRGIVSGDGVVGQEAREHHGGPAEKPEHAAVQALFTRWYEGGCRASWTAVKR